MNNIMKKHFIVFAHKGIHSRQQFIEQNTERPDVCFES